MTKIKENMKIAKSYKVHLHACVQAHARMCVSVLVSDHVKRGTKRERERERERRERERNRETETEGEGG